MRRKGSNNDEGDEQMSDSRSSPGHPSSGGKVLIVDDQAYICELLSQWLTSEGYECAHASNGEDACKALQESDFSLLISDIMMPGMSGMTLLSKVRKHYDDVAVIMATGVSDRKTAIQALKLGAYGYVIKPFDQNEVLINVANALERRRLVLQSRDYEHRLEEEVWNRTLEIRQTEEEITLHLAAAAEYRDEVTGAHIRRIGLYAGTLAEALGKGVDWIDSIRLAAPMHDIGKIGIPDLILFKPGKLTCKEFEVVKTHAVIGAKILGESKVPLLRMAAEIALSHHERWDGSGYPKGLAGGDIPLVGRLVALADVYDALVTDRPYRAAMPNDEAIAIVKSGRGRHFDPDLLDVFLREFWQFKNIQQSVKDVMKQSRNERGT